ncbi:MAG: DUF3267 domain-containing protein, partial [Lachnospiraceae bacterium]
KQLPKTDLNLKERLEKDGWIKIKEPKNLPLAILFSYPFILILCGVVILIGYYLEPELFGAFTGDTISFSISLDIMTAAFIVVTFLYTILHELIHGAFIPNVLSSSKTFWGFNGIFGFIYTQEPMKKGRFIVVSCMPFIVLSLVALPVSYLLGLLNGYTFLLFLINAGGSCVDFLNIVLIFFQVKRNRSIINNGFETYYSPE